MEDLHIFDEEAFGAGTPTLNTVFSSSILLGKSTQDRKTEINW